MNTKNSNTFEKFTNAFICKYADLAPKYIDYFEKYLVDGRVQKWAGVANCDYISDDLESTWISAVIFSGGYTWKCSGGKSVLKI